MSSVACRATVNVPEEFSEVIGRCATDKFQNLSSLATFVRHFSRLNCATHTANRRSKQPQKKCAIASSRKFTKLQRGKCAVRVFWSIFPLSIHVPVAATAFFLQMIFSSFLVVCSCAAERNFPKNSMSFRRCFIFLSKFTRVLHSETLRVSSLKVDGKFPHSLFVLFNSTTRRMWGEDY